MTIQALKRIKFKNLKRVQLSHSQRMKHYWNNVSAECKALIKYEKQEAWNNKTPEELEAIKEVTRKCAIECHAKSTVRDKKIKVMRIQNTWAEKQKRREKGELTYKEYESYEYIYYREQFPKKYNDGKGKKLVRPVRKRIIPATSEIVKPLSGVVRYER